MVPYFDPRSEWAAEEAGRRARWRFLVAFLFAMGVLFVLGVATGAEIQGADR